MALKNSQKIVIGIVAFMVLLIGWGLYPLFFQWLMIGIGTSKTQLHDFGSLGDIYGSLTALFTSATLLIVLYSAYLQREANKDAKTAMADQLQQARDATAKQLKQARKAVDDQLTQAREATTQQLDHAKEVATEQLLLVKLTHDAQIKESKYANFTNTFNSLMSYKLSRYNGLQILVKDRVWYAEEIFKEIALYFLGQDNIFDLSLSRKEIGDLYDKVLTKIAGIDKGLAELNSYFLLYESLFDIIQSSEITEQDKKIFSKIVSNSMSKHEQLSLLWAAVNIKDCYDLVRNTGIFTEFYNDNLMLFLVKFFEKSCFSHPDILKNWDRFAENQNPA